MWDEHLRHVCLTKHIQTSHKWAKVQTQQLRFAGWYEQERFKYRTWANLMQLYKPLEPGRSIHWSWISTSPHSTFLSLRHMSWTTRPSLQMMQLSSARQFCLLGCSLVMTVPLGRPCRFILRASMNGFMSNSASPILSSLLNVSWS